MEAFMTFQRYMGTGLILIWYLAALIYLYLKEKRKPFRIMFLYVPVLTLLLFFNPIFSGLFQKFLGETIYFRMIWLLPISVTLAYTMVSLLGELKGKAKNIAVLLLVLLVLISGKLVYQNSLYSRADNAYHVPWEVVEICDAIALPGREVMAAFPREFLLYVRQYSTSVCMPYGRTVMQGYCDDFELLMYRDEILAAELAEMSKARKCHYVIFSEQKTILGDLTEYDFVYFGKVGEYLIYKDTTMNFATSY